MKKTGFLAMLILACGVWSATAQADDFKVKVKDAWTRATAPGQDSGMVQAVITSKQAATLLGASCKCADSVELHSMVQEGGMMKMRQVESIALPAGEAVDMGKAGYHFMLLGLKKPIQEGKKLKLVLHVRDERGEVKQIKFSAKAKKLDASSHNHDAHGEHNMESQQHQH